MKQQFKQQNQAFTEIRQLENYSSRQAVYERVFPEENNFVMVK